MRIGNMNEETKAKEDKKWSLEADESDKDDVNAIGVNGEVVPLDA